MGHIPLRGDVISNKEPSVRWGCQYILGRADESLGYQVVSGARPLWTEDGSVRSSALRNTLNCQSWSWLTWKEPYDRLLDKQAIKRFRHRQLITVFNLKRDGFRNPAIFAGTQLWGKWQPTGGISTSEVSGKRRGAGALLVGIWRRARESWREFLPAVGRSLRVMC